MIMQDQSAVEGFLAAQRRGERAAGASVITTHISKLFLTGEVVFKLKRAVRLTYVDFSTPALRLAACQREFELNRRTAPDLYLAVRRITRQNDGTLAFDGAGTMVDSVVEMRRFDQAELFDALARAGRLSDRMVDDLVQAIARFHASAAIHLGSGTRAMQGVLDINARALRATGLVPQSELARITQRFENALRQHGALLEARGNSGKIRRCHGDLTLRNICLFNGVPTLFDCLEFDENLATIDVLYDVAFLIMDLLHRGLAQHANRVFNRYSDETGELEGLALVGFFIAVRAAVRAHVSAAQAREMPEASAGAMTSEARDYLALATAMLADPRPQLVAMGGRSGSGKSTVAAHIAPTIGLRPGARMLSSDRIRKQLYGVRPEQRLPPAAYLPEVSERVYRAQRDMARATLHTGTAVIVDAVFDRPEDRAALADLAHEAGVQFRGFWLEAPLATMAARIEARQHDPSDATLVVLQGQLARDPGALEWLRIDASATVEEIVAQVLAVVHAKPQ